MNNLFDSISDFIFVEDKPKKSDIILILGGSKPQLMERAVELYHQGLAPYILPSGGINKKLPDWDSEWEFLRNIAITNGVPESAILKEDKALSTLDNAILSWQVIQQDNIKVKRAILVCKSFHARRALLTYQIIFSSDIEFIVCPIIDDRDIRKDNWFLDNAKIIEVMEEVEKIGKYFAKQLQD